MKNLSLRHMKILFGVFVVLQLIFAGWLYPVGYMTWDSGTYHLMVKTLAETGGFFIDNGFHLFPSSLMRLGQTIVPNGELVSHYPEFYTFLALPFYAIFGYRGFAVLNSIALIGTCILIWRMTPWFITRKKARAIAVAIYLLATFAWEYSLSSYPHLSAGFLILLSCWLAWGIFLGRDDRLAVLRLQAVGLPLAGFVFGFAIGVRLDTLFGGLALLFPLLLGRGIAWRQGLWIAAGMVPPIALLAWINLLKFGIANPVSYGRSAAFGLAGDFLLYLPVAVVLVLVCLLYAYREILLARFSHRQLLLAPIIHQAPLMSNWHG